MPENRDVVPLRLQSQVSRCGAPGRIGGIGCVRSDTSICDLSSTQSTTGRPGGEKNGPTISRAFSVHSGSFDRWNVSLRRGWRPNARQMRLTVAQPGPQSFAGVDTPSGVV